MTWNIQGAAASRAREQAVWLTSEGHDVLVLTEVRSRDGYRELARVLCSNGYRMFSHQSDDGDAFVAIAVRGQDAHLVPPQARYLPHRMPEVVVGNGSRQIRIIGLYVPSRGSAHQRNVAKRAFQTAVMDRLAELQAHISDSDVIVGGDLNVADEMDRPHYRVFGAWEWEFYRHFQAVGLHDAHRQLTAKCRRRWSWIGRSGREYCFDYLMTSESMAPELLSCQYLATPRDRGLSDHAAVLIRLAR